MGIKGNWIGKRQSILFLCHNKRDELVNVEGHVKFLENYV